MSVPRFRIRTDLLQVHFLPLGLRYGPALVLVAFGFLLWEFLIRALDVPLFLFPAPSDIASSLWSNRDIFGEHAWFTLKEMILGFSIAYVCGIAIAVVLHLVPLFKKAVYPLLVTSQTIPIIVLAPIFVILLGFDLLPKLAIVAFSTFFAICVSTVDGLRSTDPALIKMMRTLDASRLTIFRRVEFPSALPMMFTGMKISATYAAIAAVFAEWSGSAAGLGYLIQQSAPLLDTARVFAAIFILSVIALGLVGLVVLLERLIAPWARR